MRISCYPMLAYYADIKLKFLHFKIQMTMLTGPLFVLKFNA